MKFVRSPIIIHQLVMLPMLVFILISGCGRSIEDTKEDKGPSITSDKEDSDHQEKSKKLLYDAILTKDRGLFDQALEENIDLDFIFENGHTPLTLSILLADNSFTNDLIKKGANPNLKNKTGLTPLHIAIFVKDIYILKNLLISGANPNLYQQNQQSPLLYAITKSAQNLAVELIIHGASLTEDENIYTYSKDRKLDKVLELLSSIDKYTEESFDETLDFQVNAPINFIKYKLQNSHTFKNYFNQLINLIEIIKIEDEIRSKELMTLAIELDKNKVQNDSIELYIGTIIYKNETIFKLLGEYKLSPIGETKEGETPLMTAVKELNIIFITLLKNTYKDFITDQNREKIIKKMLSDSCLYLPEDEGSSGRNRRFYQNWRRSRISPTKLKVMRLLNCDS